MKKIYFLAALIAIMCLVSCNNKEAEVKNGEVNDSAQTAEQESPVAGPTEYYLTQDSIGPVKVGEKISDLPAAVPNLYDNISSAQYAGGKAYTFNLADDQQFTAYDITNDDKVNYIELVSNGRGIDTPDGVIRIGDDFEKVLALKGVFSEWNQSDDGGMWYWRWEGLVIGVDLTTVSDKFADMLCNGNQAPKASLFTSKVKVGYIGTGYPFDE